MRAISDEFGGSAYQWATHPEDRTRLWKARHDAYYAALAIKPGVTAFATDACVPISRLADCILETKQDIRKSGLTAPILGHVGDGNFHLVVLFDPADGAQRERAEALAKEVSLRAIRMGGTCTGEHGIGWHKLDVLAQEHGEAVDLMRAIKRALDPDNIMNPGKTVPL
jgi:D-lactate dehydrogenase (cytochrome)